MILSFRSDVFSVACWKTETPSYGSREASIDGFLCLEEAFVWRSHYSTKRWARVYDLGAGLRII